MIPASEIKVGDYDPKNGRNSDGRFATGNAGQPKGPRHKTTRVIEELLAGEAEGLTQKAIELALAGDTMALSLCLERFAPPREYATVEFDLPAIQTAHDAAQAVLQAVSGGKLTPVEGASVMGLVEQYRRTLELTDIDPRLRYAGGGPMRLAARLARLEQRSDRNTTDVAGHTEQELALLLCENVEGLGIDRDAFKADPASAVTAFFVGVWDVEGLLDRILPSIERAGFDWLQGF